MRCESNNVDCEMTRNDKTKHKPKHKHAHRARTRVSTYHSIGTAATESDD
jgi:hypothetical protein